MRRPCRVRHTSEMSSGRLPMYTSVSIFLNSKIAKKKKKAGVRLEELEQLEHEINDTFFSMLKHTHTFPFKHYSSMNKEYLNSIQWVSKHLSVLWEWFRVTHWPWTSLNSRQQCNLWGRRGREDNESFAHQESSTFNGVLMKFHS